MPVPPTLIVIGGPTASGKTGLAIEVAECLGTEIISADSRQFYRELAIGSAPPTAEELARVRHHFVADRSVTEPLSAGRFAAEALPLAERLLAVHGTAVTVGGSGLYLTALAEGLDEFPDITPEANARVTALYNKRGLAGLVEELCRLDPKYAAVVDTDNSRRLERALRVIYSAAAPYSSFLGKRPPRNFSVCYLRLHPERTALYERIDRRVDAMLAAGLREEARGLYELRELPALQTVGYQEWWPYFDGQYDRDRAVELIKRNSRRYAKRQVTWFGRGNTYQTAADAQDAMRLIKQRLA